MHGVTFHCSKAEAYRLGFGQALFPVKMSGRNGWRLGALVVEGMVGLGWLPEKVCSWGGQVGDLLGNVPGRIVVPACEQVEEYIRLYKS